MITPLFKLHQNENYLFLEIKTPYAKLNELEVYVDENDFRFFCKPYYLRLNLPGALIENEEDEEEVKYDFDEKVFKLKYKKKKSGELFEGLDMLTKLLTPIEKTKPLIEEINGEENEEENDDDEEEDGDVWYVEQNLAKEEEEVKIGSEVCKYGFAQTKSNIFTKLSAEYRLVIDLPEPDSFECNEKKRRELRETDERLKFSDDHYLSDYFDESGMIESGILDYQPEFVGSNESEIEFTESEMDALKNLPRKTYLLDKQEKFYAFAGLVDILFAYCYTRRVNMGEANVEAGWTIAKLSSTLSWFDTFNSLEEVLVACFRRSLTYPIYRNWKLSKAVFKDLVKLLKKGHKIIIKSLLDIRKTFIDTDSRYILNDLYINDYCVWIQHVNEKKISALAEGLEKTKITKEMVGLDLECLETAGRLALEEKERDSDESETDESSSDEEGEENKDEMKTMLNEIKGLSIAANNHQHIQKPKIIELN